MAPRRTLLRSSLLLSLSMPVLGGCGSNVSVVTTTIAPSLTGSLAADPTLSLFAKMLEESGRARDLAEGGLYTLFVPTNDALQSYARTQGYENSDALISDVIAGTGPGNQLIDDVIVEGTIRAQDFAPNAGETFQTLAGTDVTISIVNGVVNLTTATTQATVSVVELVQGDVTVHIVDAVLS